jgi:hypothetical protein
LDETVLFENAERLTQRSTAHLKLFRPLLLKEHGAWGDLMVQDEITEFLG